MGKEQRAWNNNTVTQWCQSPKKQVTCDPVKLSVGGLPPKFWQPACRPCRDDCQAKTSGKSWALKTVCAG